MNVDNYLSLLQNDISEIKNRANEIARKTYGQVVSYSRNFFVPVTHQCQNRCGYCSFVSDDVKSWITPEKYIKLLEKAKNYKCSEILLTLGEKPEIKYNSAKEFLRKQGFQTTVEYIKHFCNLALEKKLLPHSNPGVLTFEELESLKESNASMGLMLESTSKMLLEKNKAHFHSPTKNPEIRLRTIEDAGRLKIPFTTGILIGIGETWEDRIRSLLEIHRLSKKYNHIQEVIVQNFNPQKNTPMQNHPPPKQNEILLTISLARIILKSNVSIQAPPNLNRARIIELLDHGANDLGGISPVSIDYINPNMVWQEETELEKKLRQNKFTLKERLPVYPAYEKYLNKRIRKIIKDIYENEEAFPTKSR